MPAALVHRIIAKKVNNKLKIIKLKDYHLYEIGVIAPDSWQGEKIVRNIYHFNKNKCEDYNFFCSKYDINNPFILGYYIHLITDAYYRKVDMIETNKETILNNIKELKEEYKINEIVPLNQSDISKINIIAEIDISNINKKIKKVNSKNGEKGLTSNKNEVIKNIDNCTNLIIEILGGKNEINTFKTR